MSRYLGDYTEDDMLYFIWSTNDANGASITRTTDGTISVYKDNSVAQSVAGITDTEDFDSLTGIHLCTIDLSNDAFYAVGADYSVVLSGASIDGKAVNAVLAHFSIENRFMVDVSDLPTNAELAARTILAAAYFDPAADAVANVTLVATTTSVTDQVSANITGVSGSATSADNLEAQYDGVTGLTGDLYPSTQAQVGNIASGTAATNTVATSFTGINPDEPIETLTYASTTALDGVTHDLAPNAVSGDTDGYYEFNVGGNGVPVGVQWQGYANSVGDEYIFYAYDWIGASWDQIESKIGLSGSTIVTLPMDMTTSHVGTGANIGLVRLRIYSAGGTTGTNISTDRVLCSFSTVFQSVGYANGSIWIDTLLGTSGAVPYVNGTADNPSDNLTDALSLSTALSIRRFQIVSGSTVSLIADATGMVGVGENWNLVLAGQLATNASVIGATITGDANIATTGSELIDCHFDTAGTGVGHTPSTAIRCGLRNEIRLLAAGTYVFKDCYSEVAGTGTPSLDFVAAIGASAVNFRAYSGGIEIKNMAAGDTMSLEGDGQLVINANCSAGTIAIRGNFMITDNVAGGFVAGGGVISDDARFDVTQIDDTIDANSSVIDILADTNELQGNQGDWATATSVDLNDNAITASKYDETTAWPIISVDSGATEIARTGADGDTLEDLSDQADLQATLAEQAKVPKSDSTVTWNATALASIKTQVDGGINTALPGTPTAGSLGDYTKRAKFALCNKWEITEATGGLEIFNDSDVSFATVAAAFTTLAGITTRKKIL